MAIWDFRPRGDLLTSVAVGVGVLAAPVVVPLAWSVVRPLLKTILKGGFLLDQTGRGAFGEATEEVERKMPEQGVVVKRPKEPPMGTHQTALAVAPKSGDIKVSAAKQGKPKPPSEKPKRQPRTGEKKSEKEKEV